MRIFKNKIVLIVLVLLGLGFYLAFRFYNTFYANQKWDFADLYNNTNSDIVVHATSAPPGYGDVLVHIEKGENIIKGSSLRFKHAGFFVVEMNKIVCKYAVSFVVWQEKENLEYGGFEDRVYQINSDGKLYVLKHGVKRPASDDIKQPQGYPLVPEKLKELKDFSIHLKPTDL